jgi:hypothetical protein
MHAIHKKHGCSTHCTLLPDETQPGLAAGILQPQVPA